MTRVTLLSKSHCHLCDQAKGVLETLGREYPLDVEVVSLESERGERLAMDTGLLFPPGVLLEGQPFSHGRLSEGKLRRELDRITAEK